MISILSKAATWSPEQPFGEAFSRVFSSRLCSAQLIWTAVMPDATVWGMEITMWHSEIGSIVEDDIGKDAWATFQIKADERYGYAGKFRKNALHIGASLAFAWEEGKRSANLERLCAQILNAESSVPV